MGRFGSRPKSCCFYTPPSLFCSHCLSCPLSLSPTGSWFCLFSASFSGLMISPRSSRADPLAAPAYVPRSRPSSEQGLVPRSSHRSPGAPSHGRGWVTCLSLNQPLWPEGPSPRQPPGDRVSHREWWAEPHRDPMNCEVRSCGPWRKSRVPKRNTTQDQENTPSAPRFAYHVPCLSSTWSRLLHIFFYSKSFLASDLLFR